MEEILEGRELFCEYNRKPVVRDVSLSLGTGQIVGLLGPNGAGKTTTFYMLAGIQRPKKGSIWMLGTDVTDWDLPKRARFGLGYLPQEPSIFRSLTVAENIQVALETKGYTGNNLEEKKLALCQEFGLTRFMHQKGWSLSGGERRRCEMARIMATEPRFLLLDEPFAGIDPLAIADIQQLLLRLRQGGVGILITDHNARDTLAICDLGYLLETGTLLAKGTAKTLAQSEAARRHYLGERVASELLQHKGEWGHGT